MRNLSDFNDIYNIQDVYILRVILEYRWQKIKDSTGFNPRCFTSASTLSVAIERVKSKVLEIPGEIADLVEKLLSGGYSSVGVLLCTPLCLQLRAGNISMKKIRLLMS